MKHKFLVSGAAVYLVAALLALAAGPGVASQAALLLRWAGILLLAVACWERRSLTSWIFLSMLVGAEIGHDFPAFAPHLRILSQIFLQMIRVILAPLLFGTLVSGIAGHADLKKVGRMGVKAILYFEVVTT
ncbi:MAG: cation:dicarboxylate symporter family transporter, partial [Bryobacteraceae bacterium]